MVPQLSASLSKGESNNSPVERLTSPIAPEEVLERLEFLRMVGPVFSQRQVGISTGEESSLRVKGKESVSGKDLQIVGNLSMFSYHWTSYPSQTGTYMIR